MPNLQDLIEMAKEDGGKFFVIDERGEVKLVIMPFEDYRRLQGRGVSQGRAEADAEAVNRAITQAQLTEQLEENIEALKVKIAGPKVSEHKLMPRQDLREEVIDPSFDFEAPKPEFEDF